MRPVQPLSEQTEFLPLRRIVGCVPIGSEGSCAGAEYVGSGGAEPPAGASEPPPAASTIRPTMSSTMAATIPVKSCFACSCDSFLPHSVKLAMPSHHAFEPNMPPPPS